MEHPKLDLGRNIGSVTLYKVSKIVQISNL